MNSKSLKSEENNLVTASDGNLQVLSSFPLSVINRSATVFTTIWNIYKSDIGSIA